MGTDQGLTASQDSDPMVPIPVSAIFADVSNRKLYETVYKDWILSDIDTTPEDLAKKHNLNISVLMEWMSTGSWVTAKDRYVRIYAQAAEMRDRMRRAKRRDGLVKKGLDAVEKLTDKAAAMLEQQTVDTLSNTGAVVKLAFGPDHLESCAQAVKTGVDLLEKMAGSGAPGGEESSEANKTSPLVVLIKGGGLPTIRNVGTTTVIDADVDQQNLQQNTQQKGLQK